MSLIKPTTQFAVSDSYKFYNNNNDSFYLTFTISLDGSIFGVYDYKGVGFIDQPLDDENNVFIEANNNNGFTDYMNYDCTPDEKKFEINFEKIKNFIASNRGDGFRNSSHDNRFGFFLNNDIGDSFTYFNFLNYIGNSYTDNDTDTEYQEPDNLFGASNKRVTTIVLMPHYLKNDSLIIYSNAFVNYPNLKDVYIYGDVTFKEAHSKKSDDYNRLLPVDHDGKINFHFIEPFPDNENKYSYDENRFKEKYKKFIEQIIENYGLEYTINGLKVSENCDIFIINDSEVQINFDKFIIKGSEVLINFNDFITKIPHLSENLENDSMFSDTMKIGYRFRKYSKINSTDDTTNDTAIFNLSVE